MTKPNPQYPRGQTSSDQRDDSQYEEDKERLENEEKEDSVPKKPKS
jgi:hypothetical protein